MNVLSRRIVDLVGKGIIRRWIILTAFLLLFAGAQNISAEPAHEIVGGDEVNPKFKYTWMAALIEIKAKAPPRLFCGGTLIEPDLVVTAAHCVDDGNLADIYVLLGAHDLTDGDENPGYRQLIKVSRLRIHRHYNATTYDNDIALLTLASEVHGLSEAALISKSSLKDPGTMATAIGWGDTAGGENDVDLPAKLQQVDLPLVSQTDCEDAWGVGEITDNMLCGWYRPGGKGTCSGDSGGPLVVKNKSQSDRWELIGITSFGGPPKDGLKCAQPQYPEVYVNVYEYLNWIKLPPAYVSKNDDTCSGNEPCFAGVQAAIDASASGTLILITNEDYDEAVNLSAPKNLTLSGGKMTDFSSRSSHTTLNSLTIKDGSIVTEFIILDGAPTPQ